SLRRLRPIPTLDVGKIECTISPARALQIKTRGEAEPGVKPATSSQSFVRKWARGSEPSALRAPPSSGRIKWALDQTGRGKKNCHRGARLGLARQLDAAAMRLDELLGDRKPEPRAFILAGQRAFDLPEMLEGAVHVVFGDADAGVA